MSPKSPTIPVAVESTAVSSDARVQDFCQDNGLTPFIEPALQLIRQSFQVAEPILLEMAEDPESMDVWICMRARIYGEVSKVLDAYDVYTDQWISEFPASIRDRLKLAFEVV